MTIGAKLNLDIPQWRQNSPAIASSGTGQGFAWDMRNDTTRLPLFFHLRGNANLDVYNAALDSWMPLATPGLNSVGAGDGLIMHPSQGPRGTITTGATTTSVVLSTALPAAVGTNQLADRGDGTGFRIRIVGSAAAASGLVVERTIIANTSGTTPTITVDSTFGFTPASGDTYEILSGRVFLLSIGTVLWKYYDIATNSFSSSLSVTNLPAPPTTDTAFVAFSEMYVSNDHKPGEGFVLGGGTYDGASKTCIVATASSSTTLTGAAMPSDLQTNEYRNFQVRIVEDTGTPTAVGQRRKISSHTSGATGVFTVATFGVTPSATAKFVVENNDDQIIMRSSATTSVYTYSISGNAWDTTTFAAAGNAVGAGVCLVQAFGITRDTSHNRLHGDILCIRGGATSALDILSIAGGATGTWSNTTTYGFLSQTFTTGTRLAYMPEAFGGKYAAVNVNGTTRFARLNVLAGVMEPGVSDAPFSISISGVGQKLAVNLMISGTDKIPVLHFLTDNQSTFYSLPMVF